MKADLLKTLSFASYTMACIMSLLSLFLFFLFDIRKLARIGKRSRTNRCRKEADKAETMVLCLETTTGRSSDTFILDRELVFMGSKEWIE